MKYIARITDCGPLSFRSGREPDRSSTLKYVPGSALLGGLASAHALLKHDPSEFNALFMSADSRFSNLYPANFEREDLQGNDTPVYPLPLTARTCKRFGGFKHDGNDADDEIPHGVFDSLIPWALFALSGYSHPNALRTVKDCPVCEAPLQPLEGFYRRNRFNPQKIGRARVSLELRTRTGINRATGAVHQRILYSREAIKAGTTFWGTISVPDAHAHSLRELVERANDTRILRLGNNRTRGFGRVTLSIEKGDHTETKEDLRKRIETFDQTLRTQAQKFGIKTPHRLYIPITLTSDTILLDRILRYQTVITPDYLAERWNIFGAELIYQNSSTRRVMGWNDLFRLPKQDEIAIGMGSVFLFGFSAPLNDDLVQKLAQMQEQGIGSRRREGFGRLLVASPFHWEVKGQ